MTVDDLKEGEICKIVSNKAIHQFIIGEEVIVGSKDSIISPFSVNSNKKLIKCHSVNSEKYWYCCIDDLLPIVDLQRIQETKANIIDQLFEEMVKGKQ